MSPYKTHLPTHMGKQHMPFFHGPRSSESLLAFAIAIASRVCFAYVAWTFQFAVRSMQRNSLTECRSFISLFPVFSVKKAFLQCNANFSAYSTSSRPCMCVQKRTIGKIRERKTEDTFEFQLRLSTCSKPV